MAPLTMEEKLIESEKLKQQGNQLFRDGKYKKAITTYSKVFAYINGTITEDSPLRQYSSALGNEFPQQKEIELINDLKISCWSNISMCYVKLEDHRKSLEFSDKVLELNPNHLKANFRKGQAYLQFRDLDNAKKYLCIAAKLDQNSVAIRTELRKLQELTKLQHEEDKKRFSGMFG